MYSSGEQKNVLVLGFPIDTLVYSLQNMLMPWDCSLKKILFYILFCFIFYYQGLQNQYLSGSHHIDHFQVISVNKVYGMHRMLFVIDAWGLRMLNFHTKAIRRYMYRVNIKLAVNLLKIFP